MIESSATFAAVPMMPPKIAPLANAGFLLRNRTARFSPQQSRNPVTPITAHIIAPQKHPRRNISNRPTGCFEAPSGLEMDILPPQFEQRRPGMMGVPHVLQFMAMLLSVV